MDKLVRLAVAAEMLGVKPQTIRKDKTGRWPTVQDHKGARVYMLESVIYELQGHCTPQKINCKVNYEEVEDGKE